MVTKTVTYKDYNGLERTEDFRFNLTQAELLEMEFGTKGGFAAMIKKIIDAKDTPALIRIFKDLIVKAYGVKSDDGRRFMKSDALIEDFVQTEAYCQIYMELATNEEAAIAFVNGVVPSSVSKAKPIEGKLAEHNTKLMEG